MLAGTESIARPVWERDAPHGSRKTRAAIIEVGFLGERPHTGIPLTTTVRGFVVGASWTLRADSAVGNRPHREDLHKLLEVLG